MRFWRANGWCCEKLKDQFDRRHERGIFVFAEPPNTERNRSLSFWVGMRIVAAKHLEFMKPSDCPADVAITIQTWYPIWFCPWCGVKLDRYYDREYGLLTDPVISEEHGFGLETPAL